MIKNSDDKPVPKGAVKEYLQTIHDIPEFDLAVIKDDIDKLPAILPNSRQAGEIKSPEQIERAIKNLEKRFDEMKTQNHPWGSYWELRRNINLLNCVLNRPGETKGYPGSTWDEKIFRKEGRL